MSSSRNSRKQVSNAHGEIMSDAIYAVSLVLASDQDVPGWRVHITAGNAGANKDVTIRQARDIAQAITDVLGIEDGETTPFEVVTHGVNALRSRLTTQLQDAEARAATVPRLRQTLE